MNPDLQRLCNAAETAPISWEHELSSSDFEAIVRAVLEELKALPWYPQSLYINPLHSIDFTAEEARRMIVAPVVDTLLRKG